MSIDIGLQEGAQQVSASAANVIARVFVSSAGTDNSVLEWDGGQDSQVAGILGYGPGPDAHAGSIARNGTHAVSVKAHASVAGVLGPLVHTGTGQAATCAITTGGPFDDLPNLTLKITKDGVLGVAQAQVALDGSNYDLALDIAAELPATLVGTKDLTTITLSALNTETFIATFDGGSPITTTFTTPTSIADIAAQINAAITTHGVASIVGGSAKYLKIVAVTKGVGGALLIGAGTADTNLGLPNTTAATGTASTYTVPGVGIKFSFPTGTYKKGDTFLQPCTAPRMTLSDLDTALAALRASGVPFGVLHICQEPLDGTDYLAWAADLDTTLSSWHNAAEDRIYPIWVMGSPLGAASTDGSGDAVVDLDMKTSLFGYTSLLGVAVGGDIYEAGTLLKGQFRRSVSWNLAEIFAAFRLSMDPGNGSIPAASAMPGGSMLAPDGVHRARDENFATVKLRPAGFTVAVRQKGGGRFKRGVTRAGSTSRFESVGVLRMAYEVSRVVYERSLIINNTDPFLAKDGTLRKSDKNAYESVYNADLAQFIVAPGHASAARTTIDGTEKVANTNGLTVTWEVQQKGQVENIKGTVSIVGELTLG